MRKRKALYIIKFYVFFLAGYIDGLSFTDEMKSNSI